MVKKVIIFSSVLLNLAFITLLGIVFFTKQLDVVMFEKSLPGVCYFLERDVWGSSNLEVEDKEEAEEAEEHFRYICDLID